MAVAMVVVAAAWVSVVRMGVAWVPRVMMVKVTWVGLAGVVVLSGLESRGVSEVAASAVLVVLRVVKTRGYVAPATWVVKSA